MAGKSAVQSQEQDSNGMVKSIVLKHREPFLIWPLLVMDDSVKTLKLSGYRPAAKNVATNAWPL